MKQNRRLISLVTAGAIACSLFVSATACTESDPVYFVGGMVIEDFTVYRTGDTEENRAIDYKLYDTQGKRIQDEKYLDKITLKTESDLNIVNGVIQSNAEYALDVYSVKASAYIEEEKIAEADFNVTVEKNMLGVTFKQPNGTELAYTEVECGQTVARPDDPQITYQTFSGWYTDLNYASEFDFSKPIVADTDIYAKLIPITHTDITFNVTVSPDSGLMEEETLWISGNFYDPDITSEWSAEPLENIEEGLWSATLSIPVEVELLNWKVYAVAKDAEFTDTICGNNKPVESARADVLECTVEQWYGRPVSTEGNRIVNSGFEEGPMKDQLTVAESGWTVEGFNVPADQMWLRSIGESTDNAKSGYAFNDTGKDMNYAADGAQVSLYRYVSNDAGLKVGDKVKFSVWIFRGNSSAFSILLGGQTFNITDTAQWVWTEVTYEYTLTEDDFTSDGIKVGLSWTINQAGSWTRVDEFSLTVVE